MISISMFCENDKDDIRQNTALHKLRGKPHAMLAAVRDHNQFLQYSQGKAKTIVGVSDDHSYNPPGFNETEHDILTLCEQAWGVPGKKAATMDKIRTIVTGLSDGLSQSEISRRLGVTRAAVSMLVAEIRKTLEGANYAT